MVDFEIMDKALKIAWINRITESSDAVWKLISEFTLFITVASLS